MKELFSLKNKVIFISGGSGYLGSYMVRFLAEQGAKVYVNGRSNKTVYLLVNKLLEDGLDASAAVFDITSEKETQHFFSGFDSETIDVLINNAHSGGGSGGVSGGTISTVMSEDYIHSYDVSVVSSHRLVKNALPFLLKASRKNGGSSVINIASMYGIISPDLSIYSSADNSNPPYYGAAKAALIQWTRYAACEFANKGIRFNSISPGAFPGVEAQKNHVLMNNIRSKIPLNRIGDPKDLLGVIILLSSHLSSYITGSNIVIDGGWTAL